MNALLFKQTPFNPDSCINNTTKLQEKYEFNHAYQHPASDAELQNHLQAQWCPPPINTLKLNFVGTFLDDRTSAATIARDQEGRFIAAVTSVDQKNTN